MADYTGRPWTEEQDEALRLGCLELTRTLGRTWNAVRGRIEYMSQTQWHVKWPDQRPAPKAFQVLQHLPTAHGFLVRQIGLDRPVSMSDAAKVFEPVGIPRPHGVLLVELMEKKGWVTIEYVGSGVKTRRRVVTVLRAQYPSPRGRRW